MVRNVFRRIQRLEARVVAATVDPIVIRVLLVHPEKGLTGVIVFDSDSRRESGTPEERERVRAELEQRRTARLQWKGGASDTRDYAPA